MHPLTGLSLITRLAGNQILTTCQLAAQTLGIKGPYTPRHGKAERSQQEDHKEIPPKTSREPSFIWEDFASLATPEQPARMRPPFPFPEEFPARTLSNMLHHPTGRVERGGACLWINVKKEWRPVDEMGSVY